jgi:hypothetical protein
MRHGVARAPRNPSATSKPGDQPPLRAARKKLGPQGWFATCCQPSIFLHGSKIFGRAKAVTSLELRRLGGRAEARNARQRSGRPRGEQGRPDPLGRPAPRCLGSVAAWALSTCFRRTRKLPPEGINVRSMKRAIAGLATTLLLSGSLGLAGLGLSAGTAQALPSWCPGQPLPNPNVNWDMGLCHYYRVDPAGGVVAIGDYYPPGVRPRPADPNWCANHPVQCHAL